MNAIASQSRPPTEAGMGRGEQRKEATVQGVGVLVRPSEEILPARDNYLARLDSVRRSDTEGPLKATNQ